LPVTTSTSASITRRAAQRLRAGHVWVYRSDLAADVQAAPGALVEVRDDRGAVLGAALYSSASQIALRLIARHVPGREELLALVRRRLDAALEYRRRVVRESDAYRVVFSEADALPGLIVDRYHDIVTFQVLTQAFDQPDLRAAVVRWIEQELSPQSTSERVEPRIRELEALPPRPSGIVSGDTAHTSTVFTVNGVRLKYEAAAGQKTGAFLDQRENYATAERWACTGARGDALDVFCYQGGFALHLARTCERVTAVDSSRPALEVAEQNEKLNFDRERIEWLEANAFEVLRDYAEAGRQYDTIVLDPPAFAKSARHVPSALRAYKELNLRALKMLRPGGVLVTCSCSFHVGEAEFVAMLASAAQDAHRTLRVLETRGAALDHPYVVSIPETHYLKCVVAAIF
jgi:23S rRNA (cytosine1962-C5)-methyltransferase